MARKVYLGSISVLARSRLGGFTVILAHNGFMGFMLTSARNVFMGFIQKLAHTVILGFTLVLARNRNYTFSAASAARNCAGVTMSWFSIDPAYGLDTGSPIISIHFMCVSPRNSFVVLRFAR